MTQIVVAMVVIVLLAGVVVAYVAFPHRGEELPGAPWLGRLMRKGARSLPTVEAVPTDVMPDDGGAPAVAGESVESPVPTTAYEPEQVAVPPVEGEGKHRA